MIAVATDNGLVNLDGKREFDGHLVGPLAQHDGELWAVVDGQHVHRRSRGGAWVEVAGSGDQITCLVSAGQVLAGTAGAHLAWVGPDGFVPVTSFEDAPGRREWYTPWGGPADARSLAADADGTLYVNVHVGGILRSTDGGGTWAPTIDLHADVHQVLWPGPDHPGMMIAACAEGLAESRDAGGTWTIRDVGLHSTYCRAVACTGDTVLVSASDGPGGTRAAVYRTRIGADQPFDKCDRGLPEWIDGNVDTGWLAGRGDQAAFVTAGGEVFVTGDQGSVWHEAAAGVGRPAWLLLD